MSFPKITPPSSFFLSSPLFFFPLIFSFLFFFFCFCLTLGSFSSDNNAVEQPRRGRWSGVDALSWLYIRGVALLAPEAPPGFVGWHAAHRINRDRRTADFYGINGVKTTLLRFCERVPPPTILYVRIHNEVDLYTLSTNERVAKKEVKGGLPSYRPYRVTVFSVHIFLPFFPFFLFFFFFTVYEYLIYIPN